MPKELDYNLPVDALDYDTGGLGDEPTEEFAVDELDSYEDSPEDNSFFQDNFTVSPLVILAAGTIIRPESTVMNITATVGGGALTLTANPPVADGVNGQLLILRGSSATDTITITDGNGMQLNGNVTLGLNDTIMLYYDGLITNDWIEITRQIGSMGAVVSGTYTPTRSAEVNLDANTVPSLAQFMRVGSVVTVSGEVTVNPTTTATLTSFELSLPIASNIGATSDCAGVMTIGAVPGEVASVTGVVANDTAKIQWIAIDVALRIWSYTYTYRII